MVENLSNSTLQTAVRSHQWLEKAGHHVRPDQDDSVNIYTKMVQEEYAPWIYEMIDAPGKQGIWRQEIFKTSEETPLDLEIGVGNGYFFENHRKTMKNRLCVGLELKYKQLIQTVKRSLLHDRNKFRLMRYDAKFLDDLFDPQELNNVYIFFPDPWEKKKQLKKRLVDIEFLNLLFELQRPGSFLEFKTDSRSYYDWVCERLKHSPYQVDFQSDNFHSTERAKDSFQTHFEKLWTRKGRPTHYLKLLKI
ncbi:MAG: tRNA (guanosine(46)-N(7))-methyltransferase TrmB [Bdellovibrionales bacterium]